MSPAAEHGTNWNTCYDGESLEPKSEVVTVEWPEGHYSLEESMLAANAGEVAIVTNVVTHRELEGALAGVSCR